MKLRIAIATLLLTALCAAQPTQWFPPEQMMTIGVYYYPEAWPESQWERDISNIKKFGFEYIHLAEFAWAFMEPEEGRYEFGWLDKGVDLARKHGLKVILCTPSATPPAWLARNHPDILMVRADGTRMNHGSREQADWSSLVYRRYVEKIVEKMAEHYGSNPTVWGWQLDNELSHYGAGMSYSPAAQQRFRDWLREKYGTVERLNRDWGNSFWSQMYNNFDQIQMPNPHELVAGANPHAMLDLHRWFASEAADYLRFQASVLRRHVKGQWITTNFMMNYDLINPALSEKDLDIMAFTMYPVSGGLFRGQLGFRMGDPAAVSFTHDFLRNLGSGIEGPMELQPGQVNWAPVNPWPQPGVIHAWIMRGFGLGARLVCVYRYRQPLAGDELYHKTMVEPDGVTLAPGGKEFIQSIKDVQLLRTLYKPNMPPPADYNARRTAFLYNFENRWDMENHKQTVRWDSFDHLLKYYRALKSLIAPVDVITEAKDFSKYPYLVAPAYQLIDKEVIARFTRYVENGGTLILTCRTGQKDRRGQIWEALWAEPIYDLVGAAIPKYDVLPEGRNGKVIAAGREYEWGSWADIIEPRPGTEVLASYADQFYKGSAAATSHRLGKGRVVYIGVDSLNGEMEADLLRTVYGPGGAKPARLPLNFMVDWRDGFWVATNFTDNDQTIPAPPDAKMLAGSRTIPPGGVAIWQ
ncbi:MAG TPA: beta-galactosidase [Bryobacteraceae bacterium]|nr:beta-galactosidase [Bryobacteraceae bacterium]